MIRPTGSVTPTPTRPGGWRVLARPGASRFMLQRIGSQPLRLRLLGQRKLGREHIRALEALSSPALARRLRVGSVLFVPRTFRGRKNTGAELRHFSLRLAKAPPLEVELLGSGTLKGSGLIETLRARIVELSAEPLGPQLTVKLTEITDPVTEET